MASELALAKVKSLRPNSIVLDPMMGSGTVLLAASSSGHRCLGFDLDPLAILISKVATSRLNTERFDALLELMLRRSGRVDLRRIKLPWVDKDTAEFIEYWFAPEQRRDLTRLAWVLHSDRSFSDSSAEANALRLAVSKLIITKDVGASLGRDISHSRPHRVADSNDFDVFEELRISAGRLKRRISQLPHGLRPTIRPGDARVLPWVRNASIDMILTSPPYLNAIDYMRGHRLSLVWLGHNLSTLRNIRSNSIGAERAPDIARHSDAVSRIKDALGRINKLPSKHQNMIIRYSTDLMLIASQTARVMKRSGAAVFVVGNSRLKDVFVSNSCGLEVAAQIAGLRLIEKHDRKLPNQNRYLPLPVSNRTSLGRRMRTETVMTFTHRT
jgi:tRNA G10  N-methylase Trm11